jgi:hypothetical protein
MISSAIRHLEKWGYCLTRVLKVACRVILSERRISLFLGNLRDSSALRASE